MTRKMDTLERQPLATEASEVWQLGIEEVTGHNLESSGRDEVNQMLTEGWILLHLYTLKYREDGVWRERPMAILGRPKSKHMAM